MKVSIALMLLVGCATGMAEEPSVYESLQEIPIGRVFLTPEARRDLDRRRGRAPLPPEPAATASYAKPETDDGFGFIILRDGRSSTWIDGDFRAGDAPGSRDTALPSGNFTIRAHDSADGDTETAPTSIVPGRDLTVVPVPPVESREASESGEPDDGRER